MSLHNVNTHKITVIITYGGYEYIRYWLLFDTAFVNNVYTHDITWIDIIYPDIMVYPLHGYINDQGLRYKFLIYIKIYMFMGYI